MARFAGHQQEKDYHALDLQLAVRIWPFLRPYRLAFGLCLLSLFLSFGLEVLRPYLIRLAVDGPVATITPGDDADYSELWTIGLWFLLSSLISIGIGYFYTYATSLNAQRVIRDVRNHVYKHLLRVSPRFFDSQPVGKLVTRITTDVENLNELIATGVLQTVFDLLKVFGMVAVMYLIDWRLATFLLAAIPILVATSLFFRRFARDSFRQVRGAQARLNGFAAEAVGGVSATRIFGQQELVLSHFDQLNEATKKSWLRTVFHFSLFFSIVDMVVHLMQAGLVYFGGLLILEDSMTFGTFLQFWIYSSMLTEPIKQLGEKYNVLQSAFASAERIFQILDEDISPTSSSTPKQLARGPSEIRCEGLRFAYKADQPVIDGIELTIPAATRTAIVGPTGAGKSTLLSMLSRMQDPDAGRILLNGTDIKELDLDDLRRRIAVVPQDVFLFQGSVMDNVRLFDESISEQRVRDALATLGALDFVLARQGGLHGKIEERGATLSQGEKQLLSFARALATDPDILVLDEATASIDTQSEVRIQKALQTLLHNRTCIVVAHRLSTVRDADQILVMRQGTITERGTHQELLSSGGLYAEMLRHAAGASSDPDPH
ncbi:MAG: ABC transporter ATP-binding protein [Planctomycetota bacterium]|nr:ABC transporter ATP-binding protein [Planctomycetota bacterium]